MNFNKIHWKSLHCFTFSQKVVIITSFWLLRVIFGLSLIQSVNVQIFEGFIRSRFDNLIYSIVTLRGDTIFIYINEPESGNNLKPDWEQYLDTGNYLLYPCIIKYCSLTEDRNDIAEIKKTLRSKNLFLISFFLLGILIPVLFKWLIMSLLILTILLSVNKLLIIPFKLSQSSSPRSAAVLQRSDIQKTLKYLNDLISVKAGRGLIAWYIKILAIARGRKTAALVRSTIIFSRSIYLIYKHQGRKGLVLRLKSLHILTMQSVGGSRIPSTQVLGPAVSRNKRGLPRVIPVVHRRLILDGSPYGLVLVKIYLSLFSLYRVINFRGSLKLRTIVDPGLHFKLSFVREMLSNIEAFSTKVLKLQLGSALPLLQEGFPLTFCRLNKTTPSLQGSISKVSASIPGIISASWAWNLPHNKDLLWSFRYLCLLFAPSSHSENSLTDPMENNKFCTNEFLRRFNWITDGVSSWYSIKPDFFGSLSGALGKLGFKLEAAGKVRVFAMVDCWTQWLLRPLHLFLFSLLEKMETDGTHDQLKPIKRLQDLGKTKFWCFDLSAATDRLPIFVQLHILNFLFGKSLGYAWAKLLVGRAYLVPRAPNGAKKLDNCPREVYYAVGQPMGALSSWAMLAITHHFVVHWAAYRAGIDWGRFSDYAVLGDDIVLADGRVATQYLILMKQLGVGIGVHKSLVSRKGCLEFAKRFFVQKVDCSPIPFKEIVAAIHDFEFSVTFALKYQASVRTLCSLLGYGYRVRARLTAHFDLLPKRLRTYALWWFSPWFSDTNLQTWLNIKSFVIRPEWIVTPKEFNPKLPSPLGDKLKTFILKEESKVVKLLKELPGWDSQGTYFKRFGDYFDYGLHSLIRRCVDINQHTRSMVNILWLINHEVVHNSLTVQFRDLEWYRSVFTAIRREKGDLQYRLVDAWMRASTKMFNIAPVQLLGEKTKVKSRPSILKLARMKDSLQKKIS